MASLTTMPAAETEAAAIARDWLSKYSAFPPPQADATNEANGAGEIVVRQCHSSEPKIQLD